MTYAPDLSAAPSNPHYAIRNKMIPEQDEENWCMACNELIYDPLCPDCISRKMISWLDEKSNIPHLKKEMLRIIKNLTTPTETKPHYVKCKHKPAAVCPSCFSEEAYDLLKKRKSTKEMLNEFSDVFNVDITRDMEKFR